jgi:hypothetical protein
MGAVLLLTDTVASSRAVSTTIKRKFIIAIKIYYELIAFYKSRAKHYSNFQLALSWVLTNELARHVISGSSEDSVRPKAFRKPWPEVLLAARSESMQFDGLIGGRAALG